MLSIRHTTRYRYTEPLLYSVQTLHLWPSSGPCQRVVDWSIQVPGRLNELPATQGNREHSFSLNARLPDGLMEVVVVAQGQVDPTGVAEYDDPEGLPPAFYRRSSALAEPHPRMTAWARERLGDKAGSPTAWRPWPWPRQWPSACATGPATPGWKPPPWKPSTGAWASARTRPT